MKMKSNGIQIIGTQRSGSNLLRVILGQSAEIAAPHPPHILKTFFPLIHRYEPLDKNNYQLLISDVVDFIRANPVPWEDISLNKDLLFQESRCFSLIELFRVIYEHTAMSKDAKFWCCKSLGNIYFSDQMETNIEGIKYIHLYRDGRDVAASFKKAVVGDKHVYQLAKKWKADQEKCLQLKRKTPSDRFFTLAYEDLIKDPELYIKRVCEFLTIPFSPSMLEYYKSRNSQTTADSGRMWANLKKPILNDNCRKFEKELTLGEIEIFEAVAGETLTQMGYPTVVSTPNKACLSNEAIQLYNYQNQERKKLIEQEQQHDMLRKIPQVEIIKRIERRENMKIGVLID